MFMIAGGEGGGGVTVFFLPDLITLYAPKILFFLFFCSFYFFVMKHIQTQIYDFLLRLHSNSGS
jgi:hypothetical protein